MFNLDYPEVNEYVLPKKNILVLSCMDLRLTDNLLNFLNFDNLQNRYDQFILAGTSLMCTKKKKDLFANEPAGKQTFHDKYGHWRKALEDHIGLAIALHDIQDVYIVEHQDCGAYANLLNPKKVDLSTLEKEISWHDKFSHELASDILETYGLNVHTFFIDLRGNVKLLRTLSKDDKKKKKK